MTRSDHGLTCDLNGCTDPAYARYHHRTDDRWINTCFLHKPVGNTSKFHYHTVNHDRFPADTRSEVVAPHSFKRMHEAGGES